MPLYSWEEICRGCENANWHNCDICARVSFCYCTLDVFPDFIRGKCDDKIPQYEDLKSAYIAGREAAKNASNPSAETDVLNCRALECEQNKGGLCDWYAMCYRRK